MLTESLNSNVKLSVYVGDDDSTTPAHIKEKVPYPVEKWTDIVHSKRSLTTRLYNLSQRGKFVNSSTLSQKVINYLVKCFTYSVFQNKGNPSALQKSLKSILPHSFGNHKNCNESWCGAKKDPIGSSVSNDFRVACGISQVNLGYKYISQTLESLNIEPGIHCISYIERMDHKATQDKLRKNSINFKRRKAQLHKQEVKSGW